MCTLLRCPHLGFVIHHLCSASACFLGMRCSAVTRALDATIQCYHRCRSGTKAKRCCKVAYIVSSLLSCTCSDHLVLGDRANGGDIPVSNFRYVCCDARKLIAESAHQVAHFMRVWSYDASLAEYRGKRLESACISNCKR